MRTIRSSSCLSGMHAPPTMHTPLPCTHLPCMPPPATHTLAKPAPCHTYPLPRIQWHTCPHLPCPLHGIHAPTCHACPCQTCPLPHMPPATHPMAYMPPLAMPPPATHAPTTHVPAMHVPVPVNRITDASENITLPQRADGNNSANSKMTIETEPLWFYYKSMSLSGSSSRNVT